MAEEINYTSVVFKTKTQPQTEAQKEEDTVYDEVKVPHKTPEQAADLNVSAGFLSDKKATNRRHHYQLLACCLGTFCVILLLGIIAVGVLLSMYTGKSHVSELNQLKDNQMTLLLISRNLTDDNNKLRSENENLRRDYNNLTVTIGNLTQAYTVSESAENQKLTAEIQNLTAGIQNLTAKNNKLNTRNQELEAQNNNLTEQIRKWSEDGVARVQQIIDAYCPIDNNNNRQCKPCMKDWLPYQSSCYVIHNSKPPDQKTWEEARHNCRGRNSDLAVIVNEDEKTFINKNSYGNLGYWIGLRVEDGRWKWINGSNLTESSWIQPPTNGHCAISVQNKGWKSVSCGEKNGWICENKAYPFKH